MKALRRAGALLLALCMVFSLTACGGPKAEDAEQYVKAVLDMMTTGSYDESVNIADAEDFEGIIQNSVNEAVDNLAASLGEDVALNDEVRAAMGDLVMTMLSKVQYTVGKAEKLGAGFDVPVTIIPVSMNEDLEDKMGEVVMAGMVELMADPNVESMTENDVVNYLMLKVVSAMKDDVENNPAYGNPTEVSVHYKELEKGLWGVDEADGEKLGKAMFSVA